MKKAFSLAELLITLIIISCILAAFAPTITKRVTSELNKKDENIISTNCSAISSDCKLCHADKCLLCSITCDNNQKKDIETCTCLNCPDNCSDCEIENNGNTKCSACSSGYYLDNNICLECENNCATCNSKAICKTCKSGYHITNSNTCISNCSDNQYMNQSGTCVNCSTISSNCTACNSAGMCTNCSSGVLINGKCSSAISNCLRYSATGTCAACNANYYLNGNSCSAVTEVSNCSAYSSNNKCISCNSNYYLINNTCQTCSSINPNCSSCNTLGQCTQCASGYYLSDGKCTTLPTPNDIIVYNNLQIMRRNVGDDSAINQKYLKDIGIYVTPVGSSCTPSETHPCCWVGHTAGVESDISQCDSNNSSYSGCSRTVFVIIICSDFKPEFCCNNNFIISV